MRIQKIIFLTTVFFGLYTTVHSQTNALAIELQDITIDGSLKDWPESVFWSNISYIYGKDEASKEDFSAQFAAGYNEAQKELYLAIRVLDDEFVGENGKSHTTQDHMLLYLDAAHDIRGGSPFFYVASNKVLEVHHKPGHFDTRNHNFTLDKAQMARQRLGNTLIYEWKIVVDERLKPNTVFGFDLMLIDHDWDTDNETILLWKEGFGKSYGAYRLGDLILLPKGTETGLLRGKISMDSLASNERINSIDIVSGTDPKLWVKSEVDTLGNFQAFLPSGTYELKPSRNYTSAVGSAGFKQNTRKIEYSPTTTLAVEADKITYSDTISISLKPRPDLRAPNKEGVPIEYLNVDEIDTFIKQWKDYLEIPAVSIALIRDNKVFFNKTFGNASNLAEIQVNQNTLFEAASITKSVFAVMVLRLAEKGIIDLDKPLYEYLPFPNIAKDERSKLITTRIVLGHQTGLPNWAWGGPGTWENGGELQLNFKPGTDFGYSGEAFNYLGRVVEHITGEDLQRLFEREVAKRFKVRDSYFFYTDEQEGRFALGHMQQYPQIKEKERIASPASSMGSNADLFKGFVLGLMNEKNMSRASYELIYEPYTRLNEDQKLYDPEIPQYVSHGFFVQETEDGKLIGHGGNNGDYDSKYAYNPDKKYAYIVFTNSNLGDEFIRALEQFLLKGN